MADAPKTTTVAQTSQWPHIALGLIALVLLGVPPYVPQLQKYDGLIRAITGLIGLGAVAAARTFLGPRICAILDMFSKTPPVTAGTIIASKAVVTDVPTANASLRVFLPLALLVLSLSACAGANAWMACELGQLPQSAQTVIPAVVQALEQGSEASALAALESIGSSLAAGQLACIVEAIAADTQKPGVSRVNASTIQHNAQAYRAAHPERVKCDR